MKACFLGTVVTIVGLSGMLGEAFAQTYPPYAPPPPGAYRGPAVPDDDDDVVALPPISLIAVETEKLPSSG